MTERNENQKNILKLTEKINMVRQSSKYGGLNNQKERLNSKNFGLGMRVALEMLASLLVGGALGWFADSFFGTKPLLLLIFITLGMFAGFRSVYKVIKNIKPEDDN